MKKRTSNDRLQRGFSLVEMLIAIAIFAVIFVAALLLYDRSTGTFKQGMEAADAQQNTRVAFDKLVTDLRMTGFDFDRDGTPTSFVGQVWQPGTSYGVNSIVTPPVPNGFAYRATAAGTSGAAQPTWPTTVGQTVTDGTVTWNTISGSSQAQQPDEQIEYAGPAAITIRGNFNYEQAPGACLPGATTPCDHGREPLLEQASLGRFPIVTTANDEIVTYALRSRDSSKNTQSVTFFADVNNGGAPSRSAYPGGNAERLVTIPNVDLTNANPPYTLFRFHLDDDGSVVASPVAENIRSLNFFYYLDVEGTQPLRDISNNPCPDGSCALGLGQWDPANPVASAEPRAIRTRIRSVRVQLVGMTDQPDYSYHDQDPVAAARFFRKVRLDTLVVPRNMGKRGFVEQSTNPPGEPTITSVCFGHCGIAKVSWNAPASGGNVEQYAVLYDTDTIGGYTYVLQVGTSLSAYVPVPVGQWDQTWYFAVQALNSYGSSIPSASYSGTPQNATQPLPPANVSISPATPLGLKLNFEAPVANVPGDVISCTPGGTSAENIPSQEAIRFRIWRDINVGFNPAAPGPNTLEVWNETKTGPDAPTINYATYPPMVSFVDKTAANCVQYYYRVRATDLCTDVGSLNASGKTGLSDYEPAIGDNAIPGVNTPSSPGEPGAVASLNVDTANSSCNGTTCSVELEWPRVVADEFGDEIVVDEYVIRVKRRLGNGPLTDYQVVNVTGASASIGATLTKVVDGLPENDGGAPATEYLYDFTVEAVQCGLAGPPSPTTTFPCAFTDGHLITAAASGSFLEGTGTSANPYLVFGAPSVAIGGLHDSTDSISAILYKGASIVQTWPAVDPGSTYGFSLPDLDDDGVTYRFVATMAQGTCERRRQFFFRGSPSNNCLVPHAAIPNISGNTPPSNTIGITLRNVCSTPLVIQASGLKWQWNENATTLFPVNTRNTRTEWPDGSGGFVNANISGGDQNPYGNRVQSPPVGASLTVPANSATYQIRWRFNQNLNNAGNPFAADPYYICVGYKVNGVGATINGKVQGTVATPCP